MRISLLSHNRCRMDPPGPADAMDGLHSAMKKFKGLIYDGTRVYVESSIITKYRHSTNSHTRVTPSYSNPSPVYLM